MRAVRRSDFAALLISLLVFPTQAFASDWEFAGWFGGGCYPNITFDPHVSGRMYLASDVAGIWTSADNGDSWQFATIGLGQSFVTQIEASQAEAGLVYAATSEGIFRSTDSAQSWAKVQDLGLRLTFDRPSGYRSIALDPRSGGSICAGTKEGVVVCSNTYGREWRKLDSPTRDGEALEVTAMQFLADGKGLLAATKGGVSLFDSAQRIWINVGPSGLANVTDLIPFKDGFAAAANGTLWIADAQGKDWHEVKGSVPGPLFRLAYDEPTGRFYAAWNKDWTGGSVVSADGGKNWAAIGTRFEEDTAGDPTRAWAPGGGRVNALKVSPHQSQTLFMTDWWGVWRSDDEGKTWVEKIKGTPNIIGSDIAFAPNGTLFVSAMDNGLLVSSDGGKTYRAAFPSKGYSDDTNGHVWRVGVLSTGRIIATSSPWNAKINQIVLSDDGGKSFRKVAIGPVGSRPKIGTVWEEGYPRAIAFDPVDSGSIYLGLDGTDGGGLFISNDAGASWKRSAGQPASVKVYNGLAIAPQDPKILYWGTVDKGIFRSLDGGRTWNEGALVGSVFDIKTGSDGSVYASGDRNGPSVFISRDQGATWTTKHLDQTGSADGLAVNPKDPKVIAVGTISWAHEMGKSIFFSRDGGESWSDITKDLPPGPGYAALSFTPDGQSLYAVRSGGGIYRLTLDKIH